MVVKRSNISPNMMLGEMLGEMLDRLTGALDTQIFFIFRAHDLLIYLFS